MATGPHFVIEGVEFPVVWIKDFRLHYWALIRDITGLDGESFVRLHNEDRHDADVDPLVLLGYAAVAYWHAKPRLARDRVAAEAAEWTSDSVKLVIPASEEADAGPPDGHDVGSSPTSSSESSSISPESKTSPDESSG